jgi:ABC-type Fe3+-hydroxamate transport system substrate-binding protein
VISSTLRSARRALPALALLGALTACGDATEEPAANADTAAEVSAATSEADAPATTTAGATATPAPTTAPSDTTDTRTVSDALGDVELPVAYERPVPLDGVYAANMLSLGVQPAAVPSDVKLQLSTVQDWLPDGMDIESLPEFGETYPLNLEALAQVDPDLIIAGDWELDYYGDKLTQIAPLFSTPWDHNGQWRDRFLRVADALGRTEEAQAVSDEFDAFVAQLPPAVTEQTVAFVRASALDDIRTDILETSFAGSVAREAGIPVLDLSAEVEIEPDASWIDLSAETLELLAGADLIVISDLSFYDPEVDPTDVVLAGSPLWESLPAVQNGKVVMVPGPVYNGGHYQAATALLAAVAEAAAGG